MATLVPTSLIMSLSYNPFPSTCSAMKFRYPVGVSSWILRSSRRKHGHGFVGSLQAAISERAGGPFDPELRSVLELATDSELYELERILFGPSYFSPLLKSFTKRAEDDYIVIGEDYEERQYFTELLESRFLFLAADARSTLRGWRPTYRDVLLDVRRKLRVPCSNKLPTEDLEVEIFLHLLQDYSSHESGTIPCSLESSKISRSHGSLELGLSQWKVQALAALKVGAAELQSTFLKGGGVLTLARIFQLLAKGLSGKMLLEAANYQIKHELVAKGGRMAALNLESRAALLAARQGFAGAASRYLGLRSMMMLLGPMLWGTFLADVVIQMLGTDYARILRAIYAFAQALQVNKVNNIG
ncbi:uncharacterized protein LOC122646077 isoform X1 [Telopea speciosissima]|uniref:uncharacterized protein LOC122646077 isoform X1 n=1 Tax=Telopea speciosissima TaxID=54955 RepID=UPI001CC598AF|nr:uncharacterized protein LOC122646077 isoform X1 [Telopea speciosissima]